MFNLRTDFEQTLPGDHQIFLHGVVVHTFDVRVYIVEMDIQQIPKEVSYRNDREESIVKETIRGKFRMYSLEEVTLIYFLTPRGGITS